MSSSLSLIEPGSLMKAVLPETDGGCGPPQFEISQKVPSGCTGLVATQPGGSAGAVPSKY